MRRTKKARLAEFRQHLQAIIEDALADSHPAELQAEPWPAPATPDSPAFSEAAGACCASCRGHCCETGSHTQAWLTPNTIRRVLAISPTSSAEQLAEQYRSHLPTRSVDGSCVYHGHRGCTLPRELRADVCNHYYCPPLKGLRDAQGSSDTVRAFIVLRKPSGRYHTRFLATTMPETAPSAPASVSAAVSTQT